MSDYNFDSLNSALKTYSEQTNLNPEDHSKYRLIRKEEKGVFSYTCEKVTIFYRFTHLFSDREKLQSQLIDDLTLAKNLNKIDVKKTVTAQAINILKDRHFDPSLTQRLKDLADPNPAAKPPRKGKTTETAKKKADRTDTEHRVARQPKIDSSASRQVKHKAAEPPKESEQRQYHPPSPSESKSHVGQPSQSQLKENVPSREQRSPPATVPAQQQASTPPPVARPPHQPVGAPGDAVMTKQPRAGVRKLRDDEKVAFLMKGHNLESVLEQFKKQQLFIPLLQKRIDPTKTDYRALCDRCEVAGNGLMFYPNTGGSGQATKARRVPFDQINISVKADGSLDKATIKETFLTPKSSGSSPTASAEFKQKARKHGHQ
jgi:hypothetical protein